MRGYFVYDWSAGVCVCVCVCVCVFGVVVYVCARAWNGGVCVCVCVCVCVLGVCVCVCAWGAGVCALSAGECVVVRLFSGVSCTHRRSRISSGSWWTCWSNFTWVTSLSLRTRISTNTLLSLLTPWACFSWFSRCTRGTLCGVKRSVLSTTNSSSICKELTGAPMFPSSPASPRSPLSPYTPTNTVRMTYNG